MQCKYMKNIALGSPSAVDTVTAADVQRLRSELAYMILADREKSWDEQTEMIRRMVFED